jgi:tetratricopeptide (TPR) repeat protein
VRNHRALVRSALQQQAQCAVEALKYAPGWHSALAQAANALRRLGSAAEALNYFEGAEDDIELSVEEAACLLETDRHDRADGLLAKIAENETPPHLRARSIELLEKVRCAEEIERLYQAAVNAAPVPCVLRSRAAWYIRCGKYDEAERDGLQSAEHEHRYHAFEVRGEPLHYWHPAMTRQAGQLALARGRFSEAAKHFEAASVRDPRSVAKADLALAKIAQGEVAAGEALWAEAVGAIALDEQWRDVLGDFDLLQRAAPDFTRLEKLRSTLLRT